MRNDAVANPVPGSSVINVVFCIDAAFWQHLGVTLASLLLQNPSEHFQVYIVSGKPATRDEWARLQQLADTAQNANLHFILFDQAALYEHLPSHGHLSTAMYLRLFMAEYLPRNVDRVLYLDSDLILIGGDIAELWNLPLGQTYLGAAFEPYNESQRMPLGFGPEDFYFNSGVMLINLHKWREERITERLLSFAEANRAILHSPDQDVLNSVLRGKVTDIGLRWNWQALFPRFLPGELRLSPEQFNAWRKKPSIVHFTSAYKPWFWRWEPHYKQLYTRTLRRTPWAENRPPDRTFASLPTKAMKLVQRNIEWYLPTLGRRLRGVK